MKQIWERDDWPGFRWQSRVLAPILRRLHFKQGLLVGKGDGFERGVRAGLVLDNLTRNGMASARLEGIQLDPQQLRRCLAIESGQVQVKIPMAFPPQVDSLSRLVVDAIQQHQSLLTRPRLHQWLHWQNQFQTADYQIPQPELPEAMSILGKELHRMIDWFNSSGQEPKLDPLLRAGIAHLWMKVMEEFIRASGKLTRAITDFALAQANADAMAFYSISPSLWEHRNSYQQVIQRTLQGEMDVTPWLRWFLLLMEKSIDLGIKRLDHKLARARFWQNQQGAGLKDEQLKVLRHLLDADEDHQGISASEYQQLAEVSKATATRHLAKLVEKDCLYKLPGGGRSTRYQLNIQQ